jgi:hypothetical protein
VQRTAQLDAAEKNFKELKESANELTELSKQAAQKSTTVANT